MNGTKNAYRQRRNRRRGLVAFNNFVLAMLSMQAFNQNEANEKRGLRIITSEVRPLVVHYDHAKDETITLSESRRERMVPSSKYAPGYPNNYSFRFGATLRRRLVDEPTQRNILSRLLGGRA